MGLPPSSNFGGTGWWAGRWWRGWRTRLRPELTDFHLCQGYGRQVGAPGPPASMVELRRGWPTSAPESTRIFSIELTLHGGPDPGMALSTRTLRSQTRDMRLTRLHAPAEHPARYAAETLFRPAG